jgi:anti-anti-sigma factor
VFIERSEGVSVGSTISVDDTGSVATVTAAGEVDLTTAPGLAASIATALATPGVATVVVDLSGVGFLDSSGIGELLRGRRSADEMGLAYRITGAAGIARRALEMTGVWTHLAGNSAPGADGR